MTTEEAVAKLDAMALGEVTTHDNEAIHGDADDVLLAVVPVEVAEAYERLLGRCRFWYA